MTPSDLIKLALKAARVLGQGQNATQQQLSDALSLLNMMMGQWARKRWMVFHLLEIKATGNGTPQYRLGPNGDFMYHWDDPAHAWDEAGLSWDQGFRINRLEKAFVRLSTGVAGQVDYPLAIVKSAEDYSTIPIKGMAGFPQLVWLDSGYPTATLNVYPAPSSAYEIHLLILNPLPRFGQLNVDINLPDEYQDALVYNLARRLLSFYGKAQDPEIAREASAALQTVKSANTQIPNAIMPAQLIGGHGYNLYTDDA